MVLGDLIFRSLWGSGNLEAQVAEVCKAVTIYVSHSKVLQKEVASQLEGQRDLVSRLVMGRTGATIWVIGVSILLTKSPRPSKCIWHGHQVLLKKALPFCIWLEVAQDQRLGRSRT